MLLSIGYSYWRLENFSLQYRNRAKIEKHYNNSRGLGAAVRFSSNHMPPQHQLIFTQVARVIPVHKVVSSNLAALMNIFY